MLFNSFEFIFVFLPVVLLVFYALGRAGKREASLYWLVLASLFFYGWWKPEYLYLIIGSILFNYWIGNLLSAKSHQPAYRRTMLTLGIGVNLASIGYFKYANFFVDNINTAFGSSYHIDTILLPLAISFFTFQQIAYLVVAYRGETREHSFRNYALFVTFFPQLIAGPIVHHKEMLPQFMTKDAKRFSSNNLMIGLTIFIIGLFKKVVIADGVAPYSDTVFAMAKAGETVHFLEAWVGATAYSLQLYFDFSGYSDMAIGIARMFGIKLPINFNSPYKSLNIIDFWRRWHITLSRFLRDYLYFSLGGNRKGPTRRQVNLMTTMLLGGLWHGAGWTFIVWGGLHGLYLVINHGWQNIRLKLAQKTGKTLGQSSMISRFFARTLTLLCIIVAWVYFRAENLAEAHHILAGMVGMNGIILPETWLASGSATMQQLASIGVLFQNTPMLGAPFPPYQDLMILAGNQVTAGANAITALLSMIAPIIMVLWMPNSQQILALEKPVLEQFVGQIQPPRLSILVWRNNVIWSLLLGAIAAYATFGTIGTSQFLYYNF